MAGWGPFSLEGQAAVVTGAARGIGFGIATRLYEAGADVLVVDLDEAGAMAAAKRLDNGAGRAVGFGADVSDPEQAEAMVRRGADELGSVDVLVNNAGIYPITPLEGIEPRVVDRLLDVNVKGVLYCSKAAALSMMSSGRGGNIVNIASMDAFHPSFPGLSVYGSTKGAVVTLTRHLALELGPRGVRVNAIAPGGIITEGAQEVADAGGMTEDERAEIQDRMTAVMPLRRMGEPDDIATVAVFLASPAARYLTGQTIIVDGGYLLR
jgi:NAD(P)-dependent dehydrogenase (short-subunit alcohol dehydrogenase family)